MIAETEIYKVMEVIFRRVFRKPDLVLSPLSTAQTIAGWDSFKYVEIIVSLEQEFKIELEGPEIDEVSNVGDLVRLVREKSAVDARS